MEQGDRPTRVLIADDDEDTRALLLEVLGEAPAVEVVGAAKDAEEAIRLAEVLPLDVAILDWVMPGGGGSKAAKVIKDKKPDIAIIGLTGMDPMHASYDMMSAGASAFIEKGCPPEELIEAIRSATRW